MKHDRVLAFILSLLLLWLPAAQATDHIAQFYLAEDAEMYTIDQVKDLTPPAGLEEMYRLFAEGNPYATVYVFCMPEGRALLSVSCLEMEQEGETQQLADRQQELAAGLVKELDGMLAAEPVFALDEIYGQQALVSTMTLNTDSGTLDARVALFYRGVDLMEVWAVQPSASRYLFDDTAAAQLESDLADLKDLEESLDFSVPEENEMGSGSDLSSVLENIISQDDQSITGSEPAYMTVTADDGAFRMDVPVDTVVVHPQSDENTVARARTLFADIKGGEECFDLWFEEITEAGGWLLLSPDTGIVAQVYVTDADSFAGMDADTMMLLEQPVLEMMQESYDHVALADESSTEVLDGMEHVWFSYDICKDDMDMLSFVLAAADDAKLYEIDLYILFSEDLDEDAVVETVTMMLQTLDYLPSMDI